MSQVRDRYATRAAGWVQMMIVRDEELHPMPEDASPGMLVARVTERIGLAALAAQRHEWSRETCRPGSADAKDESLLHEGIYLLGAAAFAINAVPRLHPNVPVTTTELKDTLLEEVDEQVKACVAEPECAYADATAVIWPAATLTLLVGACQGVCGLEGLTPLASLDEDEDPGEAEDLRDLFDDAELVDPACGEEDPNDDEEDPNQADSLASEISDSLMDAAVIAATGAQWCIERHEELESVGPSS